MDLYVWLKNFFHNFKKKIVLFLAIFRRKKINNDDFTIISNNCWGGKCYEFFGLQKQSPTVGLYFFADDYIKFVYNLEKYMSQEIKMVTAKESKYYYKLIQKNQENIPIGKLDDIEIVFLHYKNPQIAKEKWERRVKRINWDNIILKFSYMNDCTEECLKKFDRIQGVKKVMFIGKNNDNYNGSIVIPTGEDGQIKNDTKDWNKYLNIYKLINEKPTSIKNLKIN